MFAAIHSGFEQGKERLTRRLVRACQNPFVHILAHPMGRHMGKRDPYGIDFKQVCQAAVDDNKFLEINAFPVRFDLSAANTYFARQKGVQFAISTDSHRLQHLEFIAYGVTLARRGWLQAGDILNTKTLPQVLKAIKK